MIEYIRLLPLFKSLHIFGFVAWFAGLFYLVRMFVYHAEASREMEPRRGILTQQFNLMEWRVYSIICNPALIITWVFGTAMLLLNPAYLSQGWMHIKLLLLAGLTAYHLYCKKIIRDLEAGRSTMSSHQFRLFNEVPTLFLLSIVLLAVYRNGLNGLYALAGLIGFGILLMMGVKAYKRARETGKAR